MCRFRLLGYNFSLIVIEVNTLFGFSNEGPNVTTILTIDFPQFVFKLTRIEHKNNSLNKTSMFNYLVHYVLHRFVSRHFYTSVGTDVIVSKVDLFIMLSLITHTPFIVFLYNF